MTLVPSKAMVRRFRWHLVLNVATTFVMMMSSASSPLESMRCVAQKEDPRVFLITHSLQSHHHHFMDGLVEKITVRLQKTE